MIAGRRSSRARRHARDRSARRLIARGNGPQVTPALRRVRAARDRDRGHGAHAPAPPANDDKTSPYVTLPPEVKPVGTRTRSASRPSSGSDARRSRSRSRWCCGCGGGGAEAAEKPKQDAVDERKAEKDAKGLVTEIYQSVGHANTDGLMALLADPLIVFGPRQADAMGTRADALVTLQRVRSIAKDEDKKPALHSGSLEVVASPGGLSAWAVDAIDVDGQPMAVTAVLSNADDFWVVVAAALAETPSMKSVRAELKKDAVVPPGMHGHREGRPTAPRARSTVQARPRRSRSVWGDDLGKRSDAIVIGPAAGDVTRGKKTSRSCGRSATKVNTRYAVGRRGHRGRSRPTASSRGSARRSCSSPTMTSPLPLRLFSVFEKTDDDWKMIALQESLAVDEPGAGANSR